MENLVPYAVRMQHTTRHTYMLPVPGSPLSGTSMKMEPGVYQLSLAYTGPEQAFIRYRPENEGYHDVCHIAEDTSGKPRRSAPIIIQAGENTTVSVITVPYSNRGADQSSTASLQVIPLG
ncbi:hypothetical protein [Corynebacterium phocae]|nr:hypothetical protein [Corynebacterium phocae]KAA8723204.1 hypothetical protein F4V58_07780 [Corynebacterium phocae]